MIVDDTHRRHVFDTIDLLLEAPVDYSKYYYEYDMDPGFKNSLCVAVRKDSKLDSAIDNIRQCLPIRLHRDFDPANCPEE